MCSSKRIAISHRLSALKAGSGKLTLTLLGWLAAGLREAPRRLK